MGRSRAGVSINEENVLAHEETFLSILQKGPRTRSRMEGAWGFHSLEWNQEFFPRNHESEEAKYPCTLRCYCMHIFPQHQMGHRSLSFTMRMQKLPPCALLCPHSSDVSQCWGLLLVLEGRGLAAGKEKKAKPEGTFQLIKLLWAEKCLWGCCLTVVEGMLET